MGNDFKTKDGRKYRISTICILVFVISFGIAGLSPALAAIYPDFIAAVLGVLFVYCGGNVANKWAVGKTDGLTVGAGAGNLQEGAVHNGPIGARSAEDRGSIPGDRA